MKYLKQAEKLKQENIGLKELILAIREYLNSHFDSLGRSYEAHSILESRFTPAEIAFNIGMSSCGSKTNIATEMLRHIGYEVKKVHGSNAQSSDHAWITVKDLGGNKWKQFDITQEDCEITNQHKMISICHDWGEIKGFIEKAHLNGLMSDE